jgi:hypothetical protein
MYKEGFKPAVKVGDADWKRFTGNVSHFFTYEG